MISKFSVKKPYTVLVGVVLAIILGVVSFTKMTADLLPNISLPYVLVITTYPGASPETVEMAVTAPVEAAMATVSNIESIRSTSNENYSMVILEFAQTADMNAVSLEIRESLDQIKSYWDDSIGNPIIMKLNPDMLPVMIAAIGVDGMDNAEISMFAQEVILPELESIEGVASVSATGLLEESVNVIIRPEKVDEVNKKIFAAIDEKMADAEQKLADGKAELEKGQAELDKGKAELDKAGKELAEGQKGIDEGKKGLADGKAELEKKQQEISAELASQKTALLSAKTQLEGLQTNLTTAKALNEGINQISEMQRQLLGLQGVTVKYDVALARRAVAQAYIDRVTGGEETPEETPEETVPGEETGEEETPAETPEEPSSLEEAYAILDAANKDIADLKAGITENEIVKTVFEQAGRGDTLTALKELDWGDNSKFGEVTGHLGTVEMTLVAGNLGLEVQKRNLTNQMETYTGGMSYDAYVAQVNGILAAQKITDLDKAIKDLNQGLILLEQGQMTAAIEFADGKAKIALGEYQLELAQSQLTSGAEQIKTGKEQLESGQQQLDDGLKQIEEGEQQLADAKETAYDQADMNKILTVDTVSGLLTAQNFSMPAGYVTEEGNKYLIRVGDKPKTVEELQVLPLMDLHMEGVPVITLGDVADVFYTDNSADIYTNVDGSAGVMLNIQKQTGYSTGQVSDLLADRFKDLMKEHEGLTIITLMDQGIYIDMVMDSIFNNIIFGFLLAVLILILFLKDLRPTAVVAVSIPISVVTAVVCMYFSGVTLNVISLSGLALGIGMLVDNSIVVIENIYRLKSLGMDTKEASIQGAKEVAGAIMASTLTTVCVFLPIVFTEGITRQLFVDMGLTIGFSLLASLAIALTVVPAMASMILTKTKEQKEDKFFSWLARGYKKALAGSLKIKPVVLLAAFLLVFVSFGLAYTNGTAFMTDMDSTQLTVNVNLDKEAKLDDTRKVTNEVVARIMAMDDIKNVGAMTATSTMSMLGGGGGAQNAATIYVVTEEDKKLSNEEIGDLIIEKTADLDAKITVDTSSMDMSSMTGSGVSIQVRGRDLDELRRIAGELKTIIEKVEGTENVRAGGENSDEEMRIIIDRDKAVNYGLTVAQVFQQVYKKVADASAATTLVAADKDYSVYVKNGGDIALTRELLKEITLDGTGENQEKVTVKLSEVANFETVVTMEAINRADQSRYISVSASIADGYNVGLVSNDVNREIEKYKMPAGYRLVSSGENEMINDAMQQLILMMVLATAFMYLIMVAQFQSLKSPFIILFTIPLAFTGGFMGLFISGSEISVIAMIGFVMLAGVIVNNGIVLIDYINQLREEGMDKKEAILTAGETRLRPVLMTALTTILALSTMVFSHDMGSEMGKPMAIVTIGGLIYGTLMTLVVIPCVYDIFHREPKKKFVETKIVWDEEASDDEDEEEEDADEE